jgi:2-phosphosulfolactate phosphatase
MNLDVAFLPSPAVNRTNIVVIVVDVLRASSTIVTLFERGCPQVLLAKSVADGRRLARGGGHLLAGERNGLPPPDFDLGNSPVELQNLDLAGRTVVLTTSNGTVAMQKVAGARAVFVGCYLNARACCGRALELARGAGADLTVVCAGRQRRFALDDAACAGYLAATIAELEGGPVTLTDAARGALRLWQSYDDPPAAFRDSATGRRVLEIGHAEDLALCARMNVSEVVPRLAPGQPPRLIRTPAAD